jgi:hypothetical protein
MNHVVDGARLGGLAKLPCNPKQLCHIERSEISENQCFVPWSDDPLEVIRQLYRMMALHPGCFENWEAYGALDLDHVLLLMYAVIH